MAGIIFVQYKYIIDMFTVAEFNIDFKSLHINWIYSL